MLRMGIRDRFGQRSGGVLLFAGAGLDVAVRDHPGAVAHRADPACFAKRRVLQREHDGGQVKRAERRGARLKIVADTAWMNLVPGRFQPFRDRGNRDGEAAEIAIQDQEARSHDEQPQVARALPERADRKHLAERIDAGVVERPPVFAREKRARKHAFRLGEEVQIVDVACQIEIGSAGIICRQRDAEGRHRRIDHDRNSSRAGDRNLRHGMIRPHQRIGRGLRFRDCGGEAQAAGRRIRRRRIVIRNCQKRRFCHRESSDENQES
jgi:hypothetical protein